MKQYTFFFHLSSSLSNFHPASFQVEVQTFISNEQFMMYSKAMAFGDVETAHKVLTASNAEIAQKFLSDALTATKIVNNKTLYDQWNSLMMTIQKLGIVKKYNDSGWSKVRKAVVKKGVLAKFSQNKDLQAALMAIEGTYFTESQKFARKNS